MTALDDPATRFKLRNGDNWQRSSLVMGAAKVRRREHRAAGVAIVAFYVISVWISYLGTQRTPRPLPRESPAEVFSEARALHHAKQLTAGPYGGTRVVSHPGIEHGIEYVLGAAQDVLAAAADRDDITVRVELQSVSGSVHMLFLDTVIGNAYSNLSNILVTIEPKERTTDKAVLISAHYDSMVGSPGATDDASQIGVMLEAARCIVKNRAVRLATPLIFAMNGGEETFSQAAHGFMEKYAHRPLGAFINLESTGPGGPDFVFQHTGGWTIAAYARSAKHPRGAVIGQDIFESGLLPADSDYRMYSSRHYGRLPGLDVAFLLDGTAYHTDRDTVDRIRPGTIQAMGENVVAAAPEIARQLAHREATGLSETDSNDDSHVFFDIYGLYMVVYSPRIAKLLHSIPLAVAMGMPLRRWRQGPGGQRASYGGIARAAAVYTASSYSAVLGPLLLGALRVLVFGKPMLWYSDHRWGFLMYMPVAVAAMLSCQAAGQRWLRLDLVTALLGMAAAVGALAAFMTSLGLGSAAIFALWGIATLLGLPAHGKELYRRSLATALAAAWFPVALSLPVSLLLANVLMDKTSMIGPLPPPLGPLAVEGIISAIMGLSIVLATGCVGIWFVALLTRRQLRLVVGSLMMISITAIILGSFLGQPYTVAAPKRILLQHTFIQDTANASEVASQRMVVGGSDVNLIEDMLDLSNMTRQTKSRRDWQTLFPLTSRLDGPVLQPQLLSLPPIPQLPLLKLTGTQALPQGGRRLSLVLDTGEPCWGVLDMSGVIQGWSFGQGLPQSAVDEDGVAHQVVRIAGNRGSRLWSLWVDVSEGSQLRIEVAVTFWGRGTAALDKFVVERLPPWTTKLSGVTFLSDWTY